MTDVETPRDGETLGIFEYCASAGAWLHHANYGSDFYACSQRAVSLRLSLGVPTMVYLIGDAAFAGIPVVHTAALRASLRPLASAPAWDESDTEAHVADDYPSIESCGECGCYVSLGFDCQCPCHASTVDELAREV